MSRDGSAAVATPTTEMPAFAHALERRSREDQDDGESANALERRSREDQDDGESANALEPSREVPRVAPTFDDVYAAHAGFVWRTLRTFGVPAAQIEDAAQDVFVVVHRRLGEFEGRAAITTWLFAIARRVAAAHRRRAGNTRTEALTEEPAGGTDTFADASRAQAAATVLAILADMDEDKRIVFALVELEQLSVPEVAKMLDLNLNTTYSRLRLARQAFELAVKGRVQP